MSRKIKGTKDQIAQSKQHELIQFTSIHKGMPGLPRKDQLKKCLVPETDLMVDDMILNLTAKLDGLELVDISFSLDQDSLVIFGKNNKSAYYTDIKLPASIIPQSAVAKFSDGILKFSIQKQVSQENNTKPWTGMVDLERSNTELKETKERLTKFQEQYHSIQLEYQDLFVKNKKEIESKIDAYKLSVIEKLLKSIDNFELALRSVANKKNKEIKQIVVGIDLIMNDLKNMVGEEGITEVPSIGMLLDPTVHDVTECEETDKYPENTILDEYQKGYMYKNGIIRPSKVKVAIASKKKK